jgi:8-oxo-dGTP pyrophosphatase MutT (NUDIX family)
MARLVSDPAADTRDGFIAMLNAGLPRKRVISQALIRDPDDRVLLCELTYKAEWDLPGGVVEPLESPATGLIRELREELGLDVPVRVLLTVNWLPAWRGWDDACVFVFDGGRLQADSVDRMNLQPAEIRAVHWCTPAQVSARATAATIRLLGALAAQRGHYLEDGAAGTAP